MVSTTAAVPLPGKLADKRLLYHALTPRRSDPSEGDNPTRAAASGFNHEKKKPPPTPEYKLLTI